MSRVTPQRYLSTANEANLDGHGDRHLSVGYAKSPAEATERYAIMLGRDSPSRRNPFPSLISAVACQQRHRVRTSACGSRARDTPVAYMLRNRDQHMFKWVGSRNAALGSNLLHGALFEFVA